MGFVNDYIRQLLITLISPILHNLLSKKERLSNNTFGKPRTIE